MASAAEEAASALDDTASALDDAALVGLHEYEAAGLESYAQDVVDQYTTQTEVAWPREGKLAVEPPRPLALARPCGSSSEADYAREYWHDPRIHSFGNVGVLGAVHAGVAPLFTLGIDIFAYGGLDLRVQVLERVARARDARLAAARGAGGAAARPVRAVVDLGCGTGTMTRAIANQWPDAAVTAFDMSDEMLGVARSLTAAAVGSAPRVAYVRGNAERTGLPARSADVVTVSFLLHEAPARGRAAILAEARRLLAPGGALVVVDIARSYEPSATMLIGEPYVKGYQQHVDAEVRATFARGGHEVEFSAPVPGAAELWLAHAPVDAPVAACDADTLGGVAAAPLRAARAAAGRPAATPLSPAARSALVRTRARRSGRPGAPAAGPFDKQRDNASA